MNTNVRGWGLFSALGFLACFATAGGFLGQFAWFLDLFSHFRVQYLIGLSFLALILMVARRRVTAVVFLVFAAINLTVVAPGYFGEAKAAPDGPPTLRALLLNVNSSNGHSDRVKQFIQDAEPDIVVLQEINARWRSDLEWLRTSHRYALVEPREDNFGIALFSKLPIERGEIVSIGDAMVPSIVATVETSQGMLHVVATHPPPPISARFSGWRNAQLEQLATYVPSSGPVVLMGDLNVTPWNYHFQELLERSSLVDSSEGRGIFPTWPSFFPPMWIPLDHFLHSREVAVVTKQVGTDVGSDHYPVVVDFRLL